MKQLIVLSGPIAAGKSRLANSLADRYGAAVVHTRPHLEKLAAGDGDRASLQAIGERLDQDTGGRWVLELLKAADSATHDSELVVIDSARILGQVEALREDFGRSVVHIHLTAPLDVLEDRYAKRRDSAPEAEFASYLEARQNETEAHIGELAEDADIVIDTSRNSRDHVLTRAAARLGLFGPRHNALVDVMVGGQYGSEGKGNVAAYLASEYRLLVRSGGPNAGHSVWRPDGVQVQHHLPSGTTVSDAALLLTAGSVIHPAELLKEISDANVDELRLSIDPNAMIIDDQHRDDEGTLRETIGSTGSGVGAATAAKIMGRSSPPRLAKDIPELGGYLRPTYEVLAEHYAAGSRIFVEGTQGTGLSLINGPYPHVTSRDTTVSGILSEAGIPPTRVRRSIVVVRTHPIRVADPPSEGATSGYLWQELTWDEIAARSGLDLDQLKKQEHTTRTKNLRRVGEFEWDELAHAAALNGPTDIALTFVDQLDSKNEHARRFDQLTPPTIQFIEEIERVAGAPVTLISTRFHQRSIIDRRSW